MNMSISSAPVTTGAITTGAATSGSASGTGFAGALVQAIGGGSPTSTTTGGLSLPLGLVNVLGQLNVETTEGQTENLLEMIAMLVEQLEQLEQGSGIPKEIEDQMAALLAVFQGLLNQSEQSQAVVISGNGESVEAFVSNHTSASLNTKPVLQALRETLQQLSTVLAKGQGDTQAATSFTSQLKAIMDKLELPHSTVSAAGQAVANQNEATTSAIKAVNTAEEGVTVPKEALNQAAAVAQETRRPVQVLRDPVWRFNVDVNTQNTASDGQTAIVPTAVAAEETTDSHSQPAWTLLSNNATEGSEAALGKPTLPAQVPVQQFAQQIEKFLVKQFQLTQGNGTTEAKLTLNPEHLGQVDIRIIMQNGQVTAQFMTENGMARDLLDNQMSQLRQALHSQGLQVDRLEVVQQSSASSSTTFQQQEHRQSNSGNQGNGSNRRGADGLYEDPALFAAELERNSSLKEFGYGSSLNVTA